VYAPEHHGAAAGAGGAGRGRLDGADGGDVSGDVILCAREAGHYDPDGQSGFKCGKSDGAAGGWLLAGASIWSNAGAACTPHAAV
jgi:hypothetical protein